LTAIESPTDRLFLCLSGGGFRATFFHLGVLKFLHDAKRNDRRLLDEVVNVFSVSGGSIAAAHLAVRWVDYQNNFEATAKELVRFGQSDVRWKLPLTSLQQWPPLNLTRAFETHLHRLFRGTQLADLNVAGPNFHFLATELTEGASFWFRKEGFRLVDPESSKVVDAKARRNYPLARAVAASCAFPPFLQPVQLSAESDLDPDEQKDNKLKFNKLWLVDGGVYDNRGTTAAALVSGESPEYKKRRTIVISDASAPFKVEPNRKYRFNIMRPMDIMMNRIAFTDRPGSFASNPTSHLRIATALGQLSTTLSDPQRRSTNHE
jgi:predicted acylesterase/phospholipase RssA